VAPAPAPAPAEAPAQQEEFNAAWNEFLATTARQRNSDRQCQIDDLQRQLDNLKRLALDYRQR